MPLDIDNYDDGHDRRFSAPGRLAEVAAAEENALP